MKLSIVRAGAVLGVCGLALAGLGMRGNTASASPVSIALTPFSGSVASGGGSIFTDPLVSPLTITVNLAGALPNTTFMVTACAASDGFGPCVNSGVVDQITTDATGTFNGTVVVPSPGALGSVTVVDVLNPSDGYVANTAGFGFGFTPVTTSPGGFVVTPVFSPPFSPTVFSQTAAGALLVSPQHSFTFGNICPPGFFGPVTVFIGNTFQTVFCTGIPQ